MGHSEKIEGQEKGRRERERERERGEGESGEATKIVKLDRQARNNVALCAFHDLFMASGGETDVSCVGA